MAEGIFGPELEASAGIFGGLEVKKYLSDHVAETESPVLVEAPSATEASREDAMAPGDDEPGLIQSSLPLLTRNDLGLEAPVSLELAAGDDALAPVNPLVDVGIPQALGEGVALPDAGVTLNFPGSSTTREPSTAGESVAFYPNVATEADLAVAPTPTGVETFSILRSAAAPETEPIEFELSAGDELRANSSGGAEVTSNGQVKLEVLPPEAIDANGAPVPASLAVEGDTVTVTAEPSASAEYPILVDPGIAEAFSFGQGGQGFDSWVPYTSNEPAMRTANYWWTAGPTYPGLDMVAGFGGYEYIGNQARWNTYVPRYFKDYYNLPGHEKPTSYITGMYANTVLLQTFGNYANGPNLIGGLWDEEHEEWADTQGFTGNEGDRSASWPLATGGPKKGVKSGGYSLFANENQWPGIYRNGYVNGVVVEVSDEDSPSLASVSGPSEWVGTTAKPINYTAIDTGLGVAKLTVDASSLGETEAQANAKRFTSSVNSCLGTPDSPCPRKAQSAATESNITNLTFQPAYNPAAIPQGERTVKLIATDPINHVSAATSFKLKVDHTAPSLTLSGTLTEQAARGYGLSSYSLHIAAADGTVGSPQSGVAKAEVKLDGRPEATYGSGCATQNCTLAADWPLKATEHSRGPHKVEVIVTDAVGLTTVKVLEIEFGPPPQQPPVAAYSFDEGTGTTLTDVTGALHNGTISAEGTEWSNGKYGGALRFNGAKGCVSVPDSAALQLREEFTLESWVKPEGELTHLPILWKAGEGFPAYDLGIGLTTAGRGEGQIGTLAKSHTDAATPAAMEAGVWQHLALTYDGAKLRLFLNGELLTTKAVTEPNSGVAGALTIGCGNGWFFRGRIDELRIYNRALTSGEVASSISPMPIVKTTEPYAVEATEAVFTGLVNPNGHETTYRFEYGPTTSYGKTVPEMPEDSEETVEGDSPVEVEEIVEGLDPNTLYHVRAVSVRSDGLVIKGKDQTFKTGETIVAPEILLKEREELRANKPGRDFFNLNWSGNEGKTADETTAKMVHASGSRMFRVVIPGVNESMNKMFAYMAVREITILPNIVEVPSQPQKAKSLIPPMEEGTAGRKRWEDKLTKILQRYGKGGTFWTEFYEQHPELKGKNLEPEWWEIWNEPNYGPTGSEGPSGEGVADPVRYGELLGVSHSVFANVDPSAKILLGGLLTVAPPEPGQPSHMPVGEFLLKMKHSGDYQALSLHPYAFNGLQKGARLPKGESPVQHVTKLVRKNIAKARAALNRAGGREKKIWVTEIGWPVEKNQAEEDKHHRLVDAPTQRSLLNSVFGMLKEYSGTAAQSFNIKNVFYYNLQDNTEPGVEQPKQWDHHCGLREDTSGLGETGSYRKEAWRAFQEQAEAPQLGAEP